MRNASRGRKLENSLGTRVMAFSSSSTGNDRELQSSYLVSTIYLVCLRIVRVYTTATG